MVAQKRSDGTLSDGRVERAMKVQKVILPAVSGKILWMEAASAKARSAHSPRSPLLRTKASMLAGNPSSCQK
jgi:hypothetical protein